MEVKEISLRSQGEPASTEPAPKSADSAPVKAASDAAKDPAPKNVPAPKGPKKRTKTGCLTCRKRRIKCGEEKPICKNCIKSKRECEGYIQRVVFKHPLGTMGTFQSRLVAPPPLQQLAMRMPLSSGQQSRVPLAQSSGSQPPILAPRPLDLSAAAPLGLDASGSSQLHSSQTVSVGPFYCQQTPVSAQICPSAQLSSTIEHERVLSSNAVQNQVYQDSGVSTQGLLPRGHDGKGLSQARDSSQQKPGPTLHQGHGAGSAETVNWNMTTPQSQLLWTTQRATPSQQYSFDALVQSNMKGVSHMISSHTKYYDDEGDDYYDVESDEEMVDQSQAEDPNQLNFIMASASKDEHQLRSFTTPLNEPNVLASYRPTIGSSPLNNPKTARIFVHFIHATAPALSIWERHPTDSSIMLGAPVPTAQQGLWTYTLPLKALEHPALLQAILAISSLHIAKLHQAPITVSLKHYHYALRKVGVAVGLPLRRKQIETVAATLLLGFYEVMAAEHSRWNSHVAGSAQLIKEIDFTRLTRDLRAHRRRVKAQREQMARSGLWPGYSQAFSSGMSEDDPFGEMESDINVDLIGTLMGRAVNYDEFGQVEDENRRTRPKKYFTRQDIENYRIRSDLYWWYSKQDVFQSMISGNPLFTPYDQWGQCPPRAGMGQLDAIYGSWDHLVLLLARLADFGYRDRKRKIKFWKRMGGEWRPHPGFFHFLARFGGRNRQGRGTMGGSSGSPSGYAGNTFPPDGPLGSYPEGAPLGAASHPSGKVRHPQQRKESPPMYGMVPSRGPVCLPSAFANTACSRGSSSDSVEGDDVETSVSEAEAEWERILTAFDVFANALGPDFAPLPPDTTTPISTPFGLALQYRTHTIAVLWAYYYAGRILLHRLHPSMPPAMMVAAGVAASTTANYAQIIGKITAGVYYPQQCNFRAGSLSPTLSGALMEITVPVFFAAVQYTDPGQRGWTIAKLRDISRLTGWESSSAIARGCETAWVTAAKKGQGPPYEYTTKRDDNDTRGTGCPPPSQKTAGPVQSTVNTDRRFVTVSRSARTHWAMGLLALEEDLLNLELEDKIPR